MNIIVEPLTLEFEPSEIWAQKKPVRGDHIRVCRMNGLYYHHGIFVAANEVIHFTGDDDDSVLDWSKAHVIKTDLQKFLRGGTVEVKEYNDAELDDLYPVEGIVSYARTCLGDDGYNLIFNNCEHFANACTLGKYRSRQVENFFGGKNMGLWGSIKSFFGFGSSSSRSSSSYSYNYEPDKVKIAEIERDTKLKLADKENERIELMRDAQIELYKAQAISQAAIEKARAEGAIAIANQLVVMQEKMLDVAKKRIAIIEEGSLPIIREIENFYNEVGEKISLDAEEYNTKKLPQLLKILSQYEKGSPEHEIFFAQINEDRARQGKFVEQQMDRISERQNLVLQSFLSTKEKIIEQTGQITQSVAEGFLKQRVEGLLPQVSASLPALPPSDTKQLPSAENLN
ncbi:MAG: lecithin retinol acyltransferase family protein [Selenomonadaceae bacterium]|nr:lecithin retinol acyltransferase family protein [Selenomonadaceae bacterium]